MTPKRFGIKERLVCLLAVLMLTLACNDDDDDVTDND